MSAPLLSTQKLLLTSEIIQCGKDVAYFVEKYAKIQHPKRGLITFKLYDFQRDVLQDFIKCRYNIINKARQLGISTLIAAYCAWLLMFHKDKNIVVIATKIITAKNVITKVRTILKYVPRELWLSQIVTDNKYSIEMSNGSRIIASSTSRDAGRSEAASLLVIDEAAHVEGLEELWMSLLPVTAEGGSVILASTPNGTGNKFHRLFVDALAGENDFNARTLSWEVHPGRDKKWFEQETRNMPKKQIAQEYEAQFLSSGDTFIEPEDIEFVSNTTKPPIAKENFDKNLWIWEYPQTEQQYVIGADVARGDGFDYSTLQCIKVSSFEVVAEYKGKLPPELFGELLNNVANDYNRALLAPENNTFAYATMLRLTQLNYPNLFIEKKRRNSGMGTSISMLMENNNIPGFETNAKTRPLILAKLEELIRNRELKCYSQRFAEELKTFRWLNRKPEADRGYNDDLVMAMAIVCWVKEATNTVNEQARAINIALLNSISTSGRTIDDFDGTGHDVKPQYNPNSMITGFSPTDLKIKTTHGDVIDISWLISKG